MQVQAEHFAAYFRAVHGRDPFPWQDRLVHQVLDTSAAGGWPDVLAVPTGSGKTSAFDIALFALAVQPERWPRRIILVIDRRVVVDQGYEHAQRIAAGLVASSEPVAAEVAKRLRALWGGPPGQRPIECAVLRGGMPRDDAWATRPDRPVLAVSTVDQVGSRLLFRGYGVSPRMASVHAGLLGHDTLFLLDEVHLAVPFQETLSALGCHWRGFWPVSLPDRWGVVHLSATPGVQEASQKVFRLDPGGPDDAHPVLARRLLASKPARLRELAVGGQDEAARREKLAEACAEEALRLLGAHASGNGSPAVAVIVNRVASARAIARRLSAAARGELDVQLLTGRMRPLDRDAILHELGPRVLAGRDRTAAQRPLVVVATQCIEAGADFDFDGMVTECASLDALRQRFGRLDRLGERHAQGVASHATVLVRSDQLADHTDDPVYGGALRATWQWLHQLGSTVDFGVRHLPEPDPGALLALLAPRPHAPILLPAQLDAWSQTSPRPDPDPDIAAWLHGPERGAPDVQVVWRADISEPELLRSSGGSAEAAAALADLVERLSVCRPGSAEAISLPISAVRRWLAGEAPLEMADAASRVEEEVNGRRSQARASRPALSWQGDDSAVVPAAGLRPGSTVVVPAQYGGVRHANWDPDATDPVTDLGDLVQWQRDRRPLLRLLPTTLPGPLREHPLPAQVPEQTATELRASVSEWLDSLPEELPEPWRRIVALLRRKFSVVVAGSGVLTLVGKRRAREEISTEDDGASFIEREVSLDRHSSDVWRWADAFARRLRLPEVLCADLALAAWLHDAGKADPRFQRWLVGGSEVRIALLEELLAKSVQTLRDRRARTEARVRAGYPSGYRHELLSLVMIANNSEMLARAHDPELVLHLVASHHGWCRPFAPFIDDPEDLAVELKLKEGPGGLAATLSGSTRHRLARLDSGVADRFWSLTQRYGWWGLAWLEAILRLADHRASAEGAALEGGDDE